MTTEKYFPPIHAEGQYHCPHCNVFAKQRWSHLNAGGDLYSGTHYNSNLKYQTTTNGRLSEKWTVSICEHCNEVAVWNATRMIFPKKILVPQPNKDMLSIIQTDYLEAANVLHDSPRSAAAILRLALQKLCKQLGEKGENINDDIATMVKNNKLNPLIQKSFDALRITGNSALHPGELDLTEDTNRVIKLFDLINFIAEKMITEPKEISALYDGLPKDAKNAIDKRDSKSN